MKGYLFPWGYTPLQSYVRLVRGANRSFRVSKLCNGKWLAAMVGGGDSYTYDTPEEAMAITDKWLAKQGYVFLTEKTALLI